MYGFVVIRVLMLVRVWRGMGMGREDEWVFVLGVVRGDDVGGFEDGRIVGE